MTTNTTPTPRTDAAMVECHGVPLSVMQNNDMRWYVKADFARQLERELAELTNEATRLRDELAKANLWPAGVKSSYGCVEKGEDL